MEATTSLRASFSFMWLRRIPRISDILSLPKKPGWGQDGRRASLYGWSGENGNAKGQDAGHDQLADAAAGCTRCDAAIQNAGSLGDGDVPGGFLDPAVRSVRAAGAVRVREIDAAEG